MIIKAKDLKVCFICLYFMKLTIDNPDEDKIEDMTITCSLFPKGTKLIDIPVDCHYFKDAIQLYKKEMEDMICKLSVIIKDIKPKSNVKPDEPN
ncbi:unnamed protein product [marine sediment metagenome]|uniref:Uncharacterized protein n=1 Tax=marine sediment metagenome TaxID=412755 RepID=X1HQR5_9ZZZZ